MSAESAADRLSFLSVDDFGVTAAYSQNDAAPISIKGIFDRQFLAIEADNGGVTGAAVTFMCRADDLAALRFGAARQGDKLTIGTERWRVIEPQADGTGMVTLILQKV